MSNLLRRTFSGIVYVLLFLFAILFSKESYVILTSLFGLLCIWEFSKLINLKGLIGYVFFGITLILILKRLESYAVVIILGITIISSLHLIFSLVSKKEITYLNDRSKFGILTRYLIFSMIFLILLPIYKGGYNSSLMICILLMIWTNDSFAFFVGKNMGKRKLFVSVSPKKTQEGFIGGLIFTLLSAYIISHFNTDFTVVNWLVISLIISVLGTLGDLVESKFKRQANVKDSGTIMPGHGGMLDRLDSILFAAPFIYLYINFII